MKALSWGVMGTARIATGKVIPALQRGNTGNVHAIASRNLARAETLAHELGIPVAHSSYEALLADPDIDAVYIPLPNHLHVPLAVAAADAGKHVLCEKPIALSAVELEPLIDARDRNGVQIQEAFMILSHPQWIKAIEMVRDGDVGELRAVSTVFSYFNDNPDDVRNQAALGGGALYDIGCYAILAARLLFDAEPERVVSLIEHDPNFGTDRLTSVLLAFSAGKQASLTVSTQLVPAQRVQAYGTHGRLEIELPFNAPADLPVHLYLDDGIDKSGRSARRISLDPIDQYTAQGDMFARAVRGEAPPMLPLEDSRRNLQVIDAVRASARSGGWVAVDH